MKTILTTILQDSIAEDLLVLSSLEYLASIQNARKDVANGNLFNHEEVFGMA
jgi:hypothetical protein